MSSSNMTQKKHKRIRTTEDGVILGTKVEESIKKQRTMDEEVSKTETPPSSSSSTPQDHLSNGDEHTNGFALPFDPVEQHERDQLREEDEIVYGHDGQRYKITTVQGSKRRLPMDRPVRVYADGIYDLFHFGHARSLMQAKKLFPDTQLICGVCGDKITHTMKGKTVMNENERVEAVSHCRYVDEIVPHAPWVATVEFCLRHNIDFMSHGQDLTVDENGQDTYKLVKDAGMFLYVDRTEGISTSDIILRLIRDYDDYVRRNVSRGYSYRDLNVSLLKEGQIKLKDQYDKVKKTVVDMNKWQAKSEQMMEEFTRKFVGQFEKLSEKLTRRKRRPDDSESDSPTTPTKSSSSGNTFASSSSSSNGTPP